MYEFSITLRKPFTTVLDEVRDALQAERFGIVNEVDVQAIMQLQLNREILPYRIFGACDPAQTIRIIDHEPSAGAFLPCTLVVREGEADGVIVSFADPRHMWEPAINPEVHRAAGEIHKGLRRVARRLQS